MILLRDKDILFLEEGDLGNIWDYIVLGKDLGKGLNCDLGNI
jgi:hypothetical protein